jgi:RNA polymerase sigma-70 factor (sigma-E family)
MGPDETLGQLMTESGDRLLRLAYQLTHDRSAAEDVVQEALVSMYRHWRRSMPVLDHLEGYARRAVLNQFLARRRLRSSSEVVTATLPEIAAASFDDGIVDRDAVWRALGQLPARQRAVLVLRFYEDLPDAEIASLLGAREGTVRSLASRALTALRSSALVLDAEPT